MKTEKEKYFDSVGKIGSLERLRAIAGAGLGERSEAAERVVNKRLDREKKTDLVNHFMEISCKLEAIFVSNCNDAEYINKLHNDIFN